MAEARVPSTGRILYITPVYNAMLKQAEKLARTVIIGDAENKLNRTIANLDLVKIVEVPSELMKTVYDFTQGYKPAVSAKQIKNVYGASISKSLHQSTMNLLNWMNHLQCLKENGSTMKNHMKMYLF